MPTPYMSKRKGPTGWRNAGAWGTWRPQRPRAAPGPCSGSRRACRPSSLGSCRPPRKTSLSWPGEWATSRSGASAAVRQSSTSRSGIPGRSLASHVGIFATTGMGKSNLLRVLAAGVMAANGRYGLLVIDPHGEHRSELGRHPWAATPCGPTPTAASRTPRPLRISLAELSVDDLRTAYEWSRPQEEALHELERHYSAALPVPARGRVPGNVQEPRPSTGVDPAGRREGLAWLTEFAQVEDLPGFRDVELSARVALSTLQVVHRRARRIVDLPCISSDPAVSVGRRILDELLEGKVVLVDVSGLGGTEEVLVASYLTRPGAGGMAGRVPRRPGASPAAPDGCGRPGRSAKGAGREQGPRIQCFPAGGKRGPEVRSRACWP